MSIIGKTSAQSAPISVSTQLNLYDIARHWAECRQKGVELCDDLYGKKDLSHQKRLSLNLLDKRLRNQEEAAAAMALSMRPQNLPDVLAMLAVASGALDDLVGFDMPKDIVAEHHEKLHRAVASCIAVVAEVSGLGLGPFASGVEHLFDESEFTRLGGSSALLPG